MEGPVRFYKPGTSFMFGERLDRIQCLHRNKIAWLLLFGPLLSLRSWVSFRRMVGDTRTVAALECVIRCWRFCILARVLRLEMPILPADAIEARRQAAALDPILASLTTMAFDSRDFKGRADLANTWTHERFPQTGYCCCEFPNYGKDFFQVPMSLEPIAENGGCNRGCPFNSSIRGVCAWVRIKLDTPFFKTDGTRVDLRTGSILRLTLRPSPIPGMVEAETERSDDGKQRGLILSDAFERHCTYCHLCRVACRGKDIRRRKRLAKEREEASPEV